MNRILFIIIILAFLISTITAWVTKPVIYKQVVFAPEFEKVDNSAPIFDNREISAQTEIQHVIQPIEPIKTTEVQTQSVPVTSSKQIQTQTRTVSSSASVQNVKREVRQVELPQSVREIASQKSQTTQKIQQPIKTQEKVVEQVVEKVVEKPVQKTIEKPVEKPVQVQPQQQKTVQVRQLTEQEEIIAWNTWRSNLQNKIMQDVTINAPLGTKFRFSFTVDKTGMISNLKVWSDNPEYTPLATRVVKPLISSYQGKPILNFPQGTKRIVTNVTGGFQLATSSRFSRPSDYSDYETVKYMR